MLRSHLGAAGASVVLLRGDVFQPVHRLTIELFLDRDVRHRRSRRCPMPMLLPWCNPHDVARPNLLDGPTPALRATKAGGDDQRLAERVRVPRRAGAWLERHACAGSTRRSGGVE